MAASANAGMSPVPVHTWLPVEPGTELLSCAPVAHPHLEELYAGLWDSGVDPVTLELCRLRIATLVGSEADLAVRDPRAPLGDAQAGALADWPTSAMFSAAQRAALSFAEQYTLDAHGVTDEQAAELHRWYSPQQLAALTTAVATFDALARVRAVLTGGGPGEATIDVTLG